MASGMYPPWIEEIQVLDKAAKLKEVIDTQSRWFYHVLETQSFTKLNRELQLVEPKRYSTVALIGFLRGTAKFKMCLPYWDVLLIETQNEIRARGGDVEKLLIGI